MSTFQEGNPESEYGEISGGARGVINKACAISPTKKNFNIIIFNVQTHANKKLVSQFLKYAILLYRVSLIRRNLISLVTKYTNGK